MDSGTHAAPLTIPMGLHTGDPKRIRAKNGPRHMALILQGHRQWALDADLPCTDAVGAAAGRLLELIDYCAMRSLAKVTIYLFSDDIVRVPKEQIVDLLRTAMRYVSACANNMNRNNVRLSIEGSLRSLASPSRSLLMDLSKQTELNTGLQVTVSIDPSPINQAARRIDVNATTYAPLNRHQTPRAIDLFVEPDFVIRTGGPLPGHRAMVWTTQDTALYFTDAPWPDFDARGLHAALDWYGNHDRHAGIQVYLS